MLVTITTRGDAAPDLSHLLHKHPGRAQSFDLSVGTAHVFYPVDTPDVCSAALLLEVDAIALARSKRYGADAQALSRYVNDRPYASTSMLALAIGQVFRSAMGGRSTSRPERAAAPMDLELALTSVPSEVDEHGVGLASRLFAPLGWDVDETRRPLDDTRPEWGDAATVGLRLRGRVRLSDALRQLTVLLPVLDDAKHYWVGDDEVGMLLRRGEGWLAEHPLREVITTRSLAHQRSLVDDATSRLLGLDGTAGDGGAVDAPVDEASAEDDGTSARETPLYRRRAEAVLTALADVQAHTVADVGCGEGALLRHLFADRSFTTIIGTDVAPRELARAERRLRLDDVSDEQRARVRLLQSSVTYSDDRIAGLDAVVLMEVVEHVDPERLPALEASVFRAARPAAVVVTTPNAEHNVRFASLAAGRFRHPDHRFEWTRDEFRTWAQAVADRHGYTVEHRPVGDDDPEVGPPTQLALFRRHTTSSPTNGSPTTISTTTGGTAA
ncbi:3' terminal RNA ribose 2'-O-methyltransferase Hen1 [Curtobacterium sp. MCPF17_047]|uniref:3' terminal RNA ribose 2'-O-methyltransferase Hen1 n=1 Tax=unclassified Curtobacterium TaxID=257496 RepID=UPI000DA78F54|nr:MULTISPECIES: 3' terminal RNA ribose 2'-O-methyltransferase Hen1 [unclassified Curtobacterium]PZF69201.1 3' terminal RNA ribose 2'-O-methyltransferase Hen1 [Curtobacterium sp. MCPF17_047]WIB13669.1 3' terminal RNA ribose 2'-O-methyltransferase Hen1 [Curtobacterium sp. MCPF17_052]